MGDLAPSQGPSRKYPREEYIWESFTDSDFLSPDEAKEVWLSIKAWRERTQSCTGISSFTNLFIQSHGKGSAEQEVAIGKLDHKAKLRFHINRYFLENTSMDEFHEFQPASAGLSEPLYISFNLPSSSRFPFDPPLGSYILPSNKFSFQTTHSTTGQNPQLLDQLKLRGEIARRFEGSHLNDYSRPRQFYLRPTQFGHKRPSNSHTTAWWDFQLFATGPTRDSRREICAWETISVACLKKFCGEKINITAYWAPLITVPCIISPLKLKSRKEKSQEEEEEKRKKGEQVEGAKKGRIVRTHQKKGKGKKRGKHAQQGKEAGTKHGKPRLMTTNQLGKGNGEGDDQRFIKERENQAEFLEIIYRRNEQPETTTLGNMALPTPSGYLETYSKAQFEHQIRAGKFLPAPPSPRPLELQHTTINLDTMALETFLTGDICKSCVRDFEGFPSYYFAESKVPIQLPTSKTLARIHLYYAISDKNGASLKDVFKSLVPFLRTPLGKLTSKLTLEGFPIREKDLRRLFTILQPFNRCPTVELVSLSLTEPCISLLKNCLNHRCTSPFYLHLINNQMSSQTCSDLLSWCRHLIGLQLGSSEKGCQKQKNIIDNEFLEDCVKFLPGTSLRTLVIHDSNFFAKENPGLNCWKQFQNKILNPRPFCINGRRQQLRVIDISGSWCAPDFIDALNQIQQSHSLQEPASFKQGGFRISNIPTPIVICKRILVPRKRGETTEWRIESLSEQHCGIIRNSWVEILREKQQEGSPTSLRRFECQQLFFTDARTIRKITNSKEN